MKQYWHQLTWYCNELLVAQHRDSVHFNCKHRTAFLKEVNLLIQEGETISSDYNIFVPTFENQHRKSFMFTCPLIARMVQKKITRNKNSSAPFDFKGSVKWS